MAKDRVTKEQVTEDGWDFTCGGMETEEVPMIDKEGNPIVDEDTD